jgi:NAD(P)-dependent dehydrogenase (short-subunit alcohol dehydrogenase family)
VNAIAPGPFPTPGAWQRLVPEGPLEEEYRARIPAGRYGEHGELAELAAFLVSDAARYITGECVTIDGGGWLASGGQFNYLTRYPREQLRSEMERMRPPRSAP